MARDDRQAHRIQDPAQIAELVSPVRMEIVDAMASRGPCSIAQLAEERGRPADSLYYHVRKLLRCGLLRELPETDLDGTDHAGRTEAVYDVPSRRMFVEHDHHDDERMRLIADASSAMLRLTDRNLRGALLSREDSGRGLDRTAWSGRSRAWLTHAEIVEVNRLLEMVA